ncbi:MAG TPA: twin-arginine translocase TatA/TatE family subunit [Dehalococcoidia bacterium]|nr:twin-arginine translocase TatA/TatE family subunit [Dehalococcoidia bacterium]
MEFLGVGYQEVLLVLALMLVVVGPERLPGVAYQIGRAVRTMQRYARLVRDEFREEIDSLDEQYQVVRGELDDARQTLEKEQTQLQKEWRTNQAELDADLKAAIPSDPVVQEKPSLSSNGGSTGSSPAKSQLTPPQTPVSASEPATKKEEPTGKKDDEGAQDGPPLVF